MSKKLTKEEFLEKLKTDREFNNRYGRNHITEGKMVLPPCHYGFQVYTRELSLEERNNSLGLDRAYLGAFGMSEKGDLEYKKLFDKENRPTRAISLMWNQRSVDTFLGLPFNIASYGLLLEIIAKEVNMVPDELIGNLGDVHLYSNHIDAAKEQIGREMSFYERIKYANDIPLRDTLGRPVILVGFPEESYHLDVVFNVPKRTRQPFPLPTLNINTEFWKTQSRECGVGPLDTNLQGFEISDFEIVNYQSHSTIKAPLSN